MKNYISLNSYGSAYTLSPILKLSPFTPSTGFTAIPGAVTGPKTSSTFPIKFLFYIKLTISGDRILLLMPLN